MPRNDKINPAVVKSIRARIGMSQPEFARLIGDLPPSECRTGYGALDRRNRRRTRGD